jgi:hypothetical protein
MGSDPKPFVVYQNQSVMVRLLVGSLVFVVLGILFLAVPDGVGIKIIGGVSIAFFGAAGIWVANRLIRPRPMLTISSEGLEDHSTATAVGFIPWRDIAGLRLWLYGPGPQRFLAVDLNDPTAFQAARSSFRRGYGRLNQAINAPLVAIPLRFLRREVDLRRLVLEIHRRSDVRLSPELEALVDGTGSQG